MIIRVAFISPRHYRESGTPGTYKFVELLSKYCPVRVFALPPAEISLKNSRSVPLIPLDRTPSAANIERILPALKAFDPNIVYLFSQPKWPEVLQELKAHLPDAKFVFDIKSPLISDDDQRRKKIQRQSQAALHLLDALVSHSLFSVKTWIPECQLEPLECPPGFDASLFTKRETQTSNKAITDFVYIASLHPRRKARRMINGFAKFVLQSTSSATLDIYGDGPDRKVLATQVSQYGIEDAIRFKGLVGHDELMSLLPGYHAGIAWVPREVYDDAPSLKAIEYMAAGLPVIATETSAHKRLLDEGFSLDLFADDSDAMVEALTKISTYGFSEDRVKKNHETVQKYEYKNLVSNRIIPLLMRLARTSGEESNTQEYRPHIDNADLSRTCLESSSNRTGACHDRRDAMRLVIVYTDAENESRDNPRIAVGVANEMAKRGHCVYLVYEATSGIPEHRISDHVILLPVDGINTLLPTLNNLAADVLAVFSSETLSLLEFFRLSYECKVPLVIHQGFNPWLQYPCEGDGKRQILPRRIWMGELVASSAVRIRASMPEYAYWLPDFIRPQVRVFPDAISLKLGHVTAEPTDNDCETVLMTARCSSADSLVALTRAFAKVALTFPTWYLRIIGPTQSQYPIELDLATVIKDNELRNRIHISEGGKDLETEYAAALINNVAFDQTKCDKAILETMASVIPNIAHEDCPGAKELIRHEQHAFFVNSQEWIDGLADVLKRLMETSDLHERSGVIAVAEAGVFEPEHIYDQWEHLLEEATLYRDDPERLFQEQCERDLERAMHARRMRHKLAGC